jgi:hypothetical protein
MYFVFLPASIDLFLGFSCITHFTYILSYDIISVY